MPQPIRQPCVIDLSGIGALPAHAAALGRIVVTSGALEALLGHLLAYLTGTSASVTMAMFHSVTSTDAQRMMLNAAAEQMMIGAELDEFRDLMTEFRTRYGERSRLVHNVWGTSPQHPDKAIWCLAKDSTNIAVQVAAIKADHELDLFQATGGNLWRCCSTYTVQDLINVEARLVAYTARVRQLVLELEAKHPVIAARMAAMATAAVSTAEQASEPPFPTHLIQNPEWDQSAEE